LSRRRALSRSSLQRRRPLAEGRLSRLDRHRRRSTRAARVARRNRRHRRHPRQGTPARIMTISLAGRCARSGAVGGIVGSSSPAVASRCLWVGDRGVVLSQNVTDPVLGVLGLTLLQQGYGAPGTLAQLAGARANPQWRQLAVLDDGGHSALFTGARGLGVTATAQGRDCVAAGNLLANTDVVGAMVQAF